MGFDVSGLNPQYNTKPDDYPLLKKWGSIPWEERENNKEWEKEGVIVDGVKLEGYDVFMTLNMDFFVHVLMCCDCARIDIYP